MADDSLDQNPQHDAFSANDRLNGDTEEGSRDAEMEELRRLLMGTAEDEVADLQERLDHIAALKEKGQVEAMSKVLPRAISLHNPENTLLANALSPTIEKTINVSIRRNPQPFVDAIFPAIGPAIRRSIQEALKTVMDSINRTLEHSLSVQSFKWRFEAARTGRSFSEVVLAHTLNYRVEQLFLIDRKSGLPIQHLFAESVEVKDSDIVSSMLNAIQDFVRDSLGAGQEDVVESLEVGDVTVLIEPGPRAILAAVVRGIPTHELRETLKQIIEAIHLQFSYMLDAFEGDPAPFSSLRPLLRTGLVAQFKTRERKQWGGQILLGILSLLFLAWVVLSVTNYVRWQGYISELKDEPGIVVTGTSWRSGQWIVEGLVDPLATRPDALMPETLPADRIIGKWEAYMALDSTMIVRRASRLLQAPESVSFVLQGDTLIAEGSANPLWIQQARERVSRLLGVSQYMDAGITSRENASLMEALGLIDQTIVTFEQGSAVILPEQDIILDDLAVSMRELAGHSEAEGIQFRVHIYGHASTEGSESGNRVLSQMRAEAVRDALINLGISPEAISTVGTGDPLRPGIEASEAERETNRSVRFQVRQF